MTGEAAETIDQAPSTDPSSVDIQRVFRTDWRAGNGSSVYLAMIADREGKAFILDAQQVPLTPDLARQISRELVRYADAIEA